MPIVAGIDEPRKVHLIDKRHCLTKRVIVPVASRNAPKKADDNDAGEGAQHLYHTDMDMHRLALSFSLTRRDIVRIEHWRVVFLALCVTLCVTIRVVDRRV